MKVQRGQRAAYNHRTPKLRPTAHPPAPRAVRPNTVRLEAHEIERCAELGRGRAKLTGRKPRSCETDARGELALYRYFAVPWPASDRIPKPRLVVDNWCEVTLYCTKSLFGGIAFPAHVSPPDTDRIVMAMVWSKPEVSLVGWAHTRGLRRLAERAGTYLEVPRRRLYVMSSWG